MPSVFAHLPLMKRQPRDMQAIKQQIQARDTHYEDVGKMILSASPVPRGPTT
jgi:hypothetical protein